MAKMVAASSIRTSLYRLPRHGARRPINRNRAPGRRYRPGAFCCPGPTTEQSAMQPGGYQGEVWPAHAENRPGGWAPDRGHRGSPSPKNFPGGYRGAGRGPGDLPPIRPGAVAGDGRWTCGGGVAPFARQGSPRKGGTIQQKRPPFAQQLLRNCQITVR